MHMQTPTECGQRFIALLQEYREHHHGHPPLPHESKQLWIQAGYPVEHMPQDYSHIHVLPPSNEELPTFAQTFIHERAAR